MTIKVMIVDDSAVVRKVLSDMFSNTHEIEVVATAQDPMFAQKKLEKIKPDVMVLDIEMPRMDGLTFLKKIMNEKPMPVIMCSTLTEKNSKISIQALSIGAVDVIAKPKMDIKKNLGDYEKTIIDSVRSAAAANLAKVNFKSSGIRSVTSSKTMKLSLTAGVVLPSGPGNRLSSNSVIALGTSTGGTQALEYILPKLSNHCAGIVVVQHMPEIFTSAFAERLNSLCCVEVIEGHTSDVIKAGRVIIAPGGKHMVVKTRKDGLPYVEIKAGPMVSRHRPSVDVLFRSVSKSIGNNALGIIMTGMGDDGAAGLMDMKQVGAHTVAQSEDTCVVYGMPAVAMRKGAADQQISLNDIPELIESFSRLSGSA